MPTRYFEDFTPGEAIELGSHTITKDEIIAFARQFDPQPFHLDEEAAKATMYGGLLASGWHTGSITMRLLYDGLIKDTISLGSPGLDEIRWIKPVRPGDQLVIEIEMSKSRGKIAKANGVCKVAGEVVSEAEVMFSIVDSK